MRQEKWDDILESNNANIGYINVVSKLYALYNSHCPVKKKRIKQEKNMVNK